jgi:MFS family permease
VTSRYCQKEKAVTEPQAEQNAPWDGYVQMARAPIRKKQSGLGITSFVMSLVVGVGEFVLVAIAGVMTANSPGGRMDSKSPEAIVLGLLLLGGLGVAVLGLILGIVALFAPDRGKIFAWLGVAINGTILLGVVALMIIGLMMEH